MDPTGYPHTPRPQRHAPRKLIMEWKTYLSKPKGVGPTGLPSPSPGSAARDVPHYIGNEVYPTVQLV